MKRALIILPALVLLFCGGPEKGTDWPTFRGNYYRDGSSSDTGPSDKPEIIWKIDLGSRTLSSPIIAGGRMYLGHQAGMICANPKTGNKYWEFATDDKVFSTPTYHQGDIVFGCWDRKLYRLDGRKGDMVWGTMFRTAIDCSPVIADSNIYVGDFAGMFLTVGFNDGAVSRMFPTGNWIVGSAAFDGNTFYFGSRDSVFYALDKEKYETAWRFNAGGEISGSPAIDETQVYFGANNRKLFCLNRESGNLIWEFDTNGAMFSSPALYNDKLFCGSTDSTIYCLYKSTGEEIWRYRTDGIIYSSAAVCGNRIYIGCHDGNIYALDTETGGLIWKEFLDSPITSSPAIYDDVLIVAGENGAVFAFR